MFGKNMGFALAAIKILIYACLLNKSSFYFLIKVLDQFIVWIVNEPNAVIHKEWLIYKNKRNNLQSILSSLNRHKAVTCLSLTLQCHTKLWHFQNRSENIVGQILIVYFTFAYQIVKCLNCRATKHGGNLKHTLKNSVLTCTSSMWLNTSHFILSICFM